MRVFRPNPRLADQVERQPEFVRALAAAGQEARDRANTFVREVGGGWMPRGRTRSADPVELQIDGGEVRLVNTDYAGHLMEWGGRNNPPHAPLRRGVRAAGLDLKEQ